MYQPNRDSNSPVNNPFSQNSPASRFPEIPASGSSSSDPAMSQYTSWMQSGQPIYPPTSGMPAPATAQDQYSGNYNPSNYPNFGGPSPSQFGGMIPSSAGSSYQYLQTQRPQQVSSPSVYAPVQDQLHNNPGYLPQFDPYSAIGQGWSGSSPPPAPSSGPPIGASGGTGISATPASPPGMVHPREWIRTHRKELESWDTYAWKQLLGTFDALKEAWQRRKTQADEHAGQLRATMQYNYYDMSLQQQVSQLQTIAKQAEVNADSIAASIFQMHEVFSSYRQSSDVASKQRVREACNAALSGLPDWPTPTL